MADSARNLSWRQGDILSEEAAAICGLGFAEGSSEPIYSVVISHDCDLAASENKEPNAEVIIGKLVRKLGRDSFAKTARRLQIEYQSPNGQLVLELSAREKISVPKASLFTCEPRRDIVLDKQGLNILQRWLAARYRRAAFPEAFEARLRSPQMPGKTTFLDRIEGILEAGADHIRGLLFDLDEGTDVERVAPTDTYQLIKASARNLKLPRNVEWISVRYVILSLVFLPACTPTVNHELPQLDRIGQAVQKIVVQDCAKPVLAMPPIPQDVVLDIKGDKVTANDGGELVLRYYSRARRLLKPAAPQSSTQTAAP